MNRLSNDSQGTVVGVGDSIRVLEIDSRITEYLPEDEVEELHSFIGEIFTVKAINSDGSMLVCKEWGNEAEGGVITHELAIFPKGALRVGA